MIKNEIVPRMEEIICGIWAICSIVSFGFGFSFWGCIFACKSISDFICCIKGIIVTSKRGF
jgi:hypothetical protein